MTSLEEAAPKPLRIGTGVLHYQSWPTVRSTIDGVLTQTRPPDDIVIVDHASGDGSAAKLRAAYPQLDVVELPDNRGPAAGMSRTVAAVLDKDVDAVFVLTDDTELAPDALEHLSERLENEPSVGAAGPLITHQRAPELTFYAGGDIDPRTWDLIGRETPPSLKDWQGKPPHRVDCLVLAGLLVRAEAVRAAGLPDERFYHHWDDVDFSLRIGAQGWRLECVPAAVARLDLAGSSDATLLAPPPPYLTVRNRLGVLARNAPRRTVAREVLRVISWLVRDSIRPRAGSRADLKPRLWGLVHFCLGRWGPPPPT